MSETKDSMPAQPATTQLPKPTQAEIQLAEILALAKATREDISDVKEDLGKLRGTVDFIQNDAKLTKEEFRLRFLGVENRLTDLELARERNSVRAREPSKHDLETARALSDEIVARTALAHQVNEIEKKTDAQTEILNRLEKGAAKLAANPIVRSIAVMLGTAALTWLASHGGVK